MVTSDKEAPYTLVQVVCKTDPLIQVYQKDFRTGLVTQLVTSMMNQRFEELKGTSQSPLLYSGVEIRIYLEPGKKVHCNWLAWYQRIGLDTGIKTRIVKMKKRRGVPSLQRVSWIVKKSSSIL